MKGQILLVEDNADVLRSLTKVLEISEFFTIGYSNSNKAVREIENGLKYDLLLTDFSFCHGNDGHDIINISKKINPSVPVVCISAYAIDEGKNRYKDMISAYLIKPYPTEKLIGRLDALLHC